MKDPQSQTENDETPGAEYLNENDSEETGTNKNYAMPNFVPKKLQDNEIAQDTNSTNSKQREVFNVVHKCAKEYVKYVSIMLNQSTYFFRAVEVKVNLIW